MRRERVLSRGREERTNITDFLQSRRIATLILRKSASSYVYHMILSVIRSVIRRESDSSASHTHVHRINSYAFSSLRYLYETPLGLSTRLTGRNHGKNKDIAAAY